MGKFNKSLNSASLNYAKPGLTYKHMITPLMSMTKMWTALKALSSHTIFLSILYFEYCFTDYALGRYAKPISLHEVCSSTCWFPSVVTHC